MQKPPLQLLEDCPRAAKDAAFADVTPRRPREPSWIVRQRGKDDAPFTPPPAPRVPLELDQPTVSRESPPVPDSEPPVPKTEPPQPDPALARGLASAIAELAEARAQALSTTRDQLAELATLIARRVIGRELRLDPSLVYELANEGLDALGENDRVLVRLGNGFGEVARELAERLRAAGHDTEVRVDDALPLHACLIETELGSVDETVDRRLATLLQALKPDSRPPG